MPNLGQLLGPQDHLLLVGGGRMGGALLDGWLSQGLSASSVSVQEPNPSEALKNRGVTIISADARSQTDRAPVSVLVLAVKPQMAPDVLPALAPLIDEQTIIVSLMAGLSLAAIQKLCGDRPGQYIRSMPNTPAMLGRGITALIAQKDVMQQACDLAEALMASVGQTLWVADEAAIDAVTALSGSGPAYVFHLVEAMAAAGEKLGLSEEIAMALARATVSGAGAMLDQQAETAQILRENVTSPGGTTAAALAVLMRDEGLAALMLEAMRAAQKRAQELSQPDH